VILSTVVFGDEISRSAACSVSSPAAAYVVALRVNPVLLLRCIIVDAVMACIFLFNEADTFTFVDIQVTLCLNFEGVKGALCA